MSDKGTYTCLLTVDGRPEPATCAIGREMLGITAGKSLRQINYCELQDFRLRGYHLFLITNSGEIQLSELGHDTESFFENLWNAYMQRSKEALFAEGTPLYTGEGDYAFTEQGAAQHGIAKIELLDDALILCPHDHLARRIPLCFAGEPVEENFGITLTLDTGDTYRFSRIGRDTSAVFEKMCKARKTVAAQWRRAHQELDSHLDERLGERLDNYRLIRDCGCTMLTGLYRMDGDGFWFAGLKDGRAAVELVTPEQTATYLYTYAGGDRAFEYSLRHAMESVGLHREVIFADLSDKPLYQMTVDRSYHLCFLRDHNVKRVIHNAAWSKNVSDFFLV